MTLRYSLPEKVQHIYDQGILLRARILDFLKKWPTEENGHRVSFHKTVDEHQKDMEHITTEARRWFNLVLVEVLPHVLVSREFLDLKLKEVEGAIKNGIYAGGHLYCAAIEKAETKAEEAIDATLDWLASFPVLEAYNVKRNTEVPYNYTPNTAFIIMWMDPLHPELDDVCNAIKEVCQKFNIIAKRADDVEHQGIITDVVLKSIANSEFLIADLSGERPNVYYEVGYAHAIGKRPILYRRQGTSLHFDLSVHNVPEYKNITELRALLNKRFEAITGRKG